MTELRYSLEPILRLTGWSFAHVQTLAPCNGEEYRLRRAEGVTERIADRLATVAGLHVYVVWPEMAGAVMGDLMIPCAGCPVRFVPVNGNQKYHDGACKKATWARVKYQSDPEFAAMRRERSASQHKDTREYRIKQMRARRAA